MEKLDRRLKLALDTYENPFIKKELKKVKKEFLIRKEKYDYYTSRKGEEIVTVCYILTEDGIVGRGISICSEQDVYDENIGKKLAMLHALRAIKKRPLDRIQRQEVINRLIQCKCPFTKKGECNPQLSYWEMRFLFGKKNFIEEYEKIKIKSFVALSLYDVKVNDKLYDVY